MHKSIGSLHVHDLIDDNLMCIEIKSSCLSSPSNSMYIYIHFSIRGHRYIKHTSHDLLKVDRAATNMKPTVCSWWSNNLISITLTIHGSYAGLVLFRHVSYINSSFHFVFLSLDASLSHLYEVKSQIAPNGIHVVDHKPLKEVGCAVLRFLESFVCEWYKVGRS